MNNLGHRNPTIDRSPASFKVAALCPAVRGRTVRITPDSAGLGAAVVSGKVSHWLAPGARDVSVGSSRATFIPLSIYRKKKFHLTQRPDMVEYEKEILASIIRAHGETKRDLLFL
ncbi:unnamed protein product [Vicia faba]|uniref:Uncharacterized protein n=1 Tax=Vicia faba TaxID=3906 RepID=A0AAV1AD45_VICFA|nr:unnamed protein product [Vicia faba]